MEETLKMAVVIVPAAILYFVPTIIAYNRRHRNTVAVGVLNVLLGWTFLGWVVALVWSLLAQERRGK